MALQFSIAVQNALLDAIETATGTAAILRFYTGTQPANCAAAETGTLLVSMGLPSDYEAAASGGTKAKSGTWTGTAAAGGTAGHFRMMDSSGTTCHRQGSVGMSGSGADLILDNTNIAVGQVVTQATWAETAGNA
jgi:hypothetical protein